MRFVLNSVQWHLDTSPEDADQTDAFSSIDRVFRLEGSEVSHGALCHVIKVHRGNRSYYVKRYRPRGPHVRKAVGRNRAEAEQRNLAYFARMGIPVPRVVAHGSQHWLGLLRRAAIVTEEVPSSADLETLACTRPELLRNRTWRSHVTRLLAEHLRRLHEDGFTHRDLKWRNILVTAGETPQVFLIDCPSGKHTSHLWLPHYIVRDLAQLDRSARQYLSRTMRLRFYLWYRGQRRLRPQDKELLAAITTFRFRHRPRSSPAPLNSYQRGYDVPVTE